MQFHFWEDMNRNMKFILDSHQPFICSASKICVTRLPFGSSAAPSVKVIMRLFQYSFVIHISCYSALELTCLRYPIQVEQPMITTRDMKILPPTSLYNNLIMFFGQKGGNFQPTTYNPAHTWRATLALSSLIFNSFKRKRPNCPRATMKCRKLWISGSARTKTIRAVKTVFIYNHLPM